MNYRELISSALTALRGNLFRTLLTMLGIIIGIASVILIISLGDGATASINNQLSTFGTNTLIVMPGSTERRGPPSQADAKSLTLGDIAAMEDPARLGNISAVSGLTSLVAKITANGESTNTSVSGVGADYPAIQSMDIAQGEFFTKDDDMALARVVVLGSDVVKELFGDGATPVGESIKINNRSFRIIGVLREKDSGSFINPNKSVYVPVRTSMKILIGQDYVSSIMLKATNADLVDQTVGDITDLLVDRHNIAPDDPKDFTVRSSKDALATINSVTGLLTTLLAGIAGISLVVGGIGIMNIMLVTVTERTKEIGLLKAIGARDRDVLTQFLIEAIVLTLVGGIIGMTIGISLAYLISSLVHIPFVVSPGAIMLAVGVSSAVGILFGWYPARRASNLSPIDALRYE